MRLMGIIAGLIASLATSPVLALSPDPHLAVGDQHEISVSYETSQHGTDGSSGSSRGRNTFLERVIAVSDEGLELEFDLPGDASAEDRASAWQYPVRVLQLPNGNMQLLNGAELEARVDRWLLSAGLTREMCGSWIFTWNAFQIECDPNSVIADLQAINLLTVDCRQGAIYRHPETLGSAPLSRTEDGTDGATYSVTLDVDVDAVRRSRAEMEVAVGEMTQQPVTLDDALRRNSDDAINGTVEVTFKADPSESLTRRVVTTVLETAKSSGVSKTETRTVTVERRAI